MTANIQVKEGKLVVSNFETNEEEVVEYFKEIKPEDLESRFKSSLRVGVTALKTVRTAERVDYIEKEFNKLDTKFNEALSATSDEISDKIDTIFGEKGEVPSMLEKNFGEDGKVNAIMENHLGEKGTFSELLEKHFGKDGIIVKELFDPLKEGTPLNELRKMLTEELSQLRTAVGVKQGIEEMKQKSTKKGFEFEDACEEFLSKIVRIHMGDKLDRTSDTVGEVTNSKNGDFVIDVNGKPENRIVVEAKDWNEIGLPKIHKEIEEALENRAAKCAILVVKWIEALPSSVGCFNCYDENKFVIGLGSKNDGTLHEEILHVAYCWARTNLLKKSSNSQKIDFELVDSRLGEIKKQLDAFGKIQRQCTNINDASKKIWELCEETKDEIQQGLKDIWKELEKECLETT